jgi:hypothetical protein
MGIHLVIIPLYAFDSRAVGMRVKLKGALVAYLFYFCLEVTGFAALRYKIPPVPPKFIISSSS